MAPCPRRYRMHRPARRLPSLRSGSALAERVHYFSALAEDGACMDLRKTWGHAAVLFQRTRLLHWIDLLLVVGLAGLVVGAVHLAGEWRHELRPTVDIDLDNPWA